MLRSIHILEVYRAIQYCCQGDDSNLLEIPYICHLFVKVLFRFTNILHLNKYSCVILVFFSTFSKQIGKKTGNFCMIINLFMQCMNKYIVIHSMYVLWLDFLFDTKKLFIKMK